MTSSHNPNNTLSSFASFIEICNFWCKWCHFKFLPWNLALIKGEVSDIWEMLKVYLLNSNPNPNPQLYT